MGVVFAAGIFLVLTVWECRVSLFENDSYVYRDTFFILFENHNRPSGTTVKTVIEQIAENYELNNLREVDGKFESVTIICPHDSSAMEISYVGGEEVVEQVDNLREEFLSMTLTAEEHEKLRSLSKSNARFDIYHFERQQGSEEDGEMLDPGGLLLIMERIANVCEGIGLDPQSNSLL
jgi:hypothetical protein